MVYLLAYVVIGMILSGVDLHPIIESVQKKQDDPKAKEIVPFLGLIVGALIIIPLWRCG